MGNREVYNLDYLKDKGFFKNSGELEIEGKKVIWDKDNYLVYVEVESKDELEKIHNKLKKEYVKLQYFYYYIPKENKVKVFKRGCSVGFTYYDGISRSDVKKSKKDKLDKFSPENLNILFDTKDVMDRFYSELWQLRLDMAKSIKQLIKDKDKLLVVQHFIDRLVFFYFLCQLGIVKVKYTINGEINTHTMNKQTTKDFFKFLIENLNDSKLHKLLNSIFFEGLGNEAKVDSNGYVDVNVEVGEWKFDISVPYLNGGLFREKEIVAENNKKIKESEIEFTGIIKLISTLNEYNWVIGDYADDEESVNNLTPEILGHVYEKFVVGLENIGEDVKLSELKYDRSGIKYGRKKIGAYYTPEEITSYISENTVIPYLFDKLGLEKYNEMLNPRVAFDKFLENASEEELKKALSILDEIKILDPACGSGHFLVSAGLLLLDLKESIYNKLAEKFDYKVEFDSYQEVKKIIVDNLYGVDISETAVEIAKLRLWLWLVSKLKDVSKIEPLPNLEYNVRCGNSLIGWVDEKLMPIFTFIYNEDVEKCFDELIKMSPNEQKEILIKAKELLKSGKGGYSILDNYVEAFHLLYEIYKTSYGDKARKLKEILEEIRSVIYDSVNSAFFNYINCKLRDKDKIKRIEEFLSLRPFHWRVDFGWVIKDGGFDVVIGNPPYGNLLSPLEKKIIKKYYKTTSTDKVSKGSTNIASVFIERCSHLLRNNGTFGMIVPHRITRTEEFSKMIKFLLSEVDLYHIVDSGNPFKPDVNLEMVELFYKNRKEQGLCTTKSRRHKEFKGYLNKKLCKKIGILMIYFNDELEKLFNLMCKDAMFNVIDATQGKPRRRDYVENGKIICVGARDIDPYIIKIKSNRRVTEEYVIKNKLEWQLKNELLVCPNFTNKFEVAVKKKGLLPDGTCVVIKPKIDIDKYYLMAILNSEIINFYLWNFILNRGELTNNICSFITNRIPIKLKNVEKISKLSKNVECGKISKSVVDKEIEKIYLGENYEFI